MSVDDDLERLMADCQAADDYLEEWRLRAKRTQMPENPTFWLDEIEARLPAALEKVSSDVADEFRQLITVQLRICRIELARGVEDNTKIHFAVLAENVERLKDNIAIQHRNASQQHRREGGLSAGELKRCEAQARIEKARSIWEGLDKPERNKAGIVAARMGVPADTVRRWKREGWKPKRKTDTS